MTVLPEYGPVFHWFLPTRGDSDTSGVIPAFSDTVLPPDRRLPTLEYLTEVARATEYAGLHSVLTPGALAVRTPGALCSAVAARTDRFGFIVAVRPSLASPTLLAQQADTNVVHVESGFPAWKAAVGGAG